MPLALPDQPRRFYENNSLRLVVCQLRFPVLHRFDEPGALARFQEVLAGRYPRSSPEQQLTIASAPAASTAATAAMQYWRFQGVDDGWSVAIARDFVSLETTRYERYEDFRDRLGEVIEATLTLGVTHRERLGLRYVDEIRPPDADGPADFRDFLNAELLGMVGGPELGEDVIQALQEIRLREDDGTLAIRHGYIGPDAADGKCFYLLDLDYYDESSHALDPVQVLEQVDAYHHTMHNVWENAITDELRNVLGVKEQVGA
jgi:uncharacterized protein (TIGR04255 family)